MGESPGEHGARVCMVRRNASREHCPVWLLGRSPSLAGAVSWHETQQLDELKAGCCEMAELHTGSDE